MALSHSPHIVTDGLALCLDAANPKSITPFDGNFLIKPFGSASTVTSSTTLTASAQPSNDLYLAFLSSDLSYSGLNDSNFTERYNQSNFNGTATVLFSSSTTHNTFVTGGSCTGSQLILLPLKNVKYKSFAVSDVNSKTPPAVSALATDIVLVVLFHQDVLSPAEVSPPSGYTLIVNQDNGSTTPGEFAAGVAVAYKQVSSTSTETPGDWTINNTLVADVHLSMTIVLENGAETGPTWYDLSVNKNSDNLMNGIGFDSNDFGSLTFGGIDEYVSYDITCDKEYYSISWWLYPNNTANYNQWMSFNDAWNNWVFHTTTLGSVYVGTDTATRMTPTNIPDGTIVANVWQNLCYTFDNGVGKFYKNGVLIATKSGMNVSANTFTKFWIGSQSQGTNTINGKISHVSVYNNKVLTPQEIQQNFNTIRSRYGI